MGHSWSAPPWRHRKRTPAGAGRSRRPPPWSICRWWPSWGLLWPSVGQGVRAPGDGPSLEAGSGEAVKAWGQWRGVASGVDGAYCGRAWDPASSTHDGLPQAWDSKVSHGVRLPALGRDFNGG